MTYNVDLMLQVRNHIKMRPETHYQGLWETHTADCGTARCIAGWAIYLATGKSVEEIEAVGIAATAADLLGLSLIEAVGVIDENGDYNGLFYEMDEGNALAKLDEFIEKGKNGA
ncbi:hypothetical protein [Streptomyces sp. NPDC015131]|uniref:hypothetical protein n=1 Tax=Streptomyces sp. NPDC015131 TaxID=3364941 RepID=UPI0036F6C588